MMKLNWWSISFFVAAVLLGMLLLRSCQKQTAIETRYADSLARRKFVTDSIQKEGIKTKIAYDSIFRKNTSDSAIAKKSNDSLRRIINTLQGKYSIVKDSIGTLWGQLKTFYQNGDTADLRTAYYSLRDQLTQANQLLFAVQVRRDTLEYRLQNNLDSSYATINALRTQLATLKSLLDAQTANSNAANNDQAKILSAQKKKRIWDLIEKIGIGIAAFVIGNKL